MIETIDQEKQKEQNNNRFNYSFYHFNCSAAFINKTEIPSRINPVKMFSKTAKREETAQTQATNKVK